MSCTRAHLVLVAVLIPAAGAAFASGASPAPQRPSGDPAVIVPPSATSCGAALLTATVLARYCARTRDSDLLQLELLVLYRGEPGWHSRPRAAGGSTTGGGSGSPPSPQASGGSTTRRGLEGGLATIAVYGGIDLTFFVDGRQQRALIQGRHTVDLRESNVVFLDHVDNGAGGVVVGTLRIEAGLVHLPGLMSHQRILPLLRAAPEFASFLRCGEDQPALMERDVCAEILAR